MSIERENHLRNMALATLVAHCAHEIHDAVRGEGHNDQHWKELLRRSTLQREAREVLLHHISLVVQEWIACHPKKETALRQKSEVYYVVRTCEQFWQATVRQEPALDRLSTALQYARASLHGAMQDTQRAHERFTTMLSLEPFEKDAQIEWESICKLLPAEREQRVAYLLFQCGLQPREIIRLYPQEFNSLEEISRVRRTVIERLMYT